MGVCDCTEICAVWWSVGDETFGFGEHELAEVLACLACEIVSAEKFLPLWTCLRLFVEPTRKDHTRAAIEPSLRLVVDIHAWILSTEFVVLSDHVAVFWETVVD